MMQHNDDIGTKEDLAGYRLQTAKSNLNAARILLEAKEYKSANNRAYYAIFQAINAIHALSGKAYKRHGEAIGSFNKDYVKTEIFPRDIGRKIAQAEEIRHASDYDDFYIASHEEAQRLVTNAEEFIQLTEAYLAAQVENSGNVPRTEE